MTDAATEARWDRDRDLRKHDGPRPHDPPLPIRLETGPLSTAMDVALIVRGMKNPQEAAKLIEWYAAAKAAADRLDKAVSA